VHLAVTKHFFGILQACDTPPTHVSLRHGSSLLFMSSFVPRPALWAGPGNEAT